MKKVFVSMIADLVHVGHLRLLEKAATYGEVVVGLKSENACIQLNDVPLMSFEHRRKVLESIGYVSEVFEQKEDTYTSILNQTKPDIIVHGDNWVSGSLKVYRDEVIAWTKANNAELVEVPYSRDISTSELKRRFKELGFTTATRLTKLRELIEYGKTLRIMEVHNALSGLIVEKTSVESLNMSKVHFDGMWSSSLTDSTSKGKPDIEAVDLSNRLTTVNEIFEVTTKPMIFDADTGGKTEHFELTVKSLERTGVSAVIIEDKTGLKKNSLFGTDVEQTQDSIANFCDKIKRGKAAQLSTSFMIIARVESLILDKGLEDALERAFAYVNAGADGIMIHSRRKDGREIIDFIERFRLEKPNVPLVVVPTSFNHLTIEDFEKLGVNVVIYANHMLRSAYPGMKKVAETILVNGRSLEAESDCLSIKEILNLIPGTK